MVGSRGKQAAFTRDEFAAHLRVHYASLTLVASAVVGRSGAEDAVQDAALVALDRLDRFTPGTDFRAWMAAIVRGVARNHRRAATRRTRRHAEAAVRDERDRPNTDQPAGPGSGLGSGTAGGRVPGERSAVDFALSDAFDADVRNAVDALEPFQRACLLLRTVSGNTYAEIAVMLDIQEATARSHVLRARRRMVKMLTPAGQTAADGV